MMLRNYTEVNRLSEWDHPRVKFTGPWKYNPKGNYFSRMDNVGQIFVVRCDNGAIFYI